jgi:hypothetical protein
MGISFDYCRKTEPPQGSKRIKTSGTEHSLAVPEKYTQLMNALFSTQKKHVTGRSM